MAIDYSQAHDVELVLLFRRLFADLVAAVPDTIDATQREKRSRVVTMMLRATAQELVAHMGPNMKAITYCAGQEFADAIVEHLRAKKEAHEDVRRN
jgi:hypothetical protein